MEVNTTNLGALRVKEECGRDLISQIEITFDLNILRNRLLSAMSHLISSATEPRLNGEL